MNNIIPIYPDEESCGLSDHISKSSAKLITRCVKSTDNDKIKRIIDLAKSKEFGEQDNIHQEDLCIISSILVSTGMNLNDDIFQPKEIFRARSTPIHKPINIEHDETVIVGHMFDSRVVNKDGNELNIENESDLPEDFDIEVAGVLYKSLPKLSSKISDVIKKAEDGELSVSMEAFFTDFAYGLRSETDSSITIVKRNKETAFLTKHLRIYGGTGKIEHDGSNFEIGRVLLNITFAGKGIVAHPANPDSVIKRIAANFKDGTLNDLNLENCPRGGVDRMENLEKELKEVKSDLKDAQDKVESTAKDMEKISDENKTLSEKNEVLTKELDQTKETVSQLEAQVEDTTKNSEVYKKQADEAQAKLDKIEKERVAQSRFDDLNKISEISEDKVEDTKAELGEMGDDEFTRLIKYVKNSAPSNSEFGPDGDSAREEKAREAKDFTDKEAIKASESLDNVETEEDPDLTVSNDDEDETMFKNAVSTANALLGNYEEEKE